MLKNILILGAHSYLAQQFLKLSKIPNNYYGLDIVKQKNPNFLYLYEGSVADACLLKHIIDTHNIHTVIHCASPKINSSQQLESYLNHYTTALFPMIFFYNYQPSIKQIIIGTEPKRLLGVDSYKLAKLAQQEFALNKPNIHYLEFQDFGNHTDLESLIPQNETKDTLENLLITLNKYLSTD